MKDTLFNLSYLSGESDSSKLNKILLDLDKEEKCKNNQCSVKDSINKFKEYRTNLEKTKLL